MERLKRNEVDVNQTWDLSDLFASKEEYDQALASALEKTEVVKTYKGKLLSSPEFLLKAITDFEDLIIDLSALGNYASLVQSVDATDVSAQELSMSFGSTATKIQTEITFFENEVSAITDEQYKDFFVKCPELETYRPFIEDIYEDSKYKLSDETEEVLAALGEVTGAPYGTYSISKAADMVFDDIEDENGNTLPNSFNLFEGKYEYSEDGVLRKNAYQSFNKTLKQYKNTYASIYSTEVKKHIALSRARGYQSATEMLLKPQKVTKEMYNRQIDVIYNELAPHMRKYAKLLKEQLGLETLNFYDLKAPLDTTYNPGATYDEAKQVVLDSLEIMGEEYLEIMNKAFDNRWIDYCDNIGKGSGAFCASPYAAHPYVFVSFQHNMRDAFTLAHELGHAGHFYLANKEQKYFNTSPSMYTVEAPSTMNEMLLGRHLLTTTDDKKMKKWVILQFMGTYYHNFVTHLLEAAYQRKVYDFAEQNIPLTAQLLCDTKLEVIKTFWGDAVEVDEDAGLTWMRQPHYYMGLYPYTYSAGLTASTACSEMIFNEGQEAVDRWIEMLKTGGKLKPLELLKVAGMDFNSDEPVQKAVAYVGSLIDQLKELSE